MGAKDNVRGSRSASGYTQKEKEALRAARAKKALDSATQASLGSPINNAHSANGADTMAPKTPSNKPTTPKADNKASTKAPAAQSTAPAQAPAKAAPTPEQTDPQAILAIKDRKLTRNEVTALRKAHLKKDGSPIVGHTGPRTGPAVTLVSVKNAVETFGVESLVKLQAKYGNDLRKPLRQYAATFKEDSDDRKAMDALYASLFPAGKRGGFNTKDDAAVNKQGRVSIDVRGIGGKQGSRVSKGEVVTLTDGRMGIFIMLLAHDAPVAAEVTPTAAPEAAQAPAGPAWGSAGAAA